MPQINATTLVQGGSNPQASPAACCASCAANAECNTWSYCGLAEGAASRRASSSRCVAGGMGRSAPACQRGAPVPQGPRKLPNRLRLTPRLPAVRLLRAQALCRAGGGAAPIYGNSGIDVVPVLAGFNVPVPDSEAGAAAAATATPAGETLVGTAGR